MYTYIYTLSHDYHMIHFHTSYKYNYYMEIYYAHSSPENVPAWQRIFILGHVLYCVLLPPLLQVEIYKNPLYSEHIHQQVNYMDITLFELHVVYMLSACS